MNCKVTVTLRIDPQWDQKPTDEGLRASVVQAVQNALQRTEEMGFDHPLSEQMALHVVSVESDS
jgi:hypothetical protein